MMATSPFQPVLSRKLRTRRDIRFPQGVASGDPTPQSIVLWTRAVDTRNNLEPVRVIAQISRDISFHEIVAEKECLAKNENDFTVKVIAYDLEPDTRYYYRFIAENSVSDITGRTRTAPDFDSDRKIRFAIASCQSFEGGYYNAFRELINRDKTAPDNEKIDFVLHLGDFIYETLGYGNVRKLDPFPSGGGTLGDNVEWARSFAVTLDDYRYLYKMYLQDPDLKEARARWPFIVTWDDHEFTDDSWQGVSTYSVPDIPAQERKLAANQAWFEYIPAFLTGLADATNTKQNASDFKHTDVINNPVNDFDEFGFSHEKNNRKAIKSLTIYRSFRWGKNAELFITDTRSYRSQHPVPGEIALEISGNARYIAPLTLVKISDAGRSYNNGNPPEFIEIGESKIPNKRKDSPPGTMLGIKQKNWLKKCIQQSGASWNLLASSVPMMPMRLDLSETDPNSENVVFTTDTWEGYLNERNEILNFIKSLGRRNLISLSGDNHNSFAGVLKADFENRHSETVGAEFSVCGISSTSVFEALYNIVEKESPLRPIVTYDSTCMGGNDPKVENLNAAFLWGTKSAIALSENHNQEEAMSLRNPLHNRHLRYVDSAANGIALISVDRSVVSGEFITIRKPDQMHKDEKVDVLRNVHLEYRKGSDLRLLRIEGVPPHPVA